MKDTPHYEGCIRFRIYSCRKRKDKYGLRQAFEKHKDIDIKKIYLDNGNTVSIYIDIIDGCFDVGLSDEGSSLMEQVNSLPINSA